MASTVDLFPWFRNFWINPVTDWERFINPQFNITVNQGDAAVENHVLALAGSYGKQMGRMQEVLDVLIERSPSPPLSPIEMRAIEKYRETRQKVLDAVDEAAPDKKKRFSDDDMDAWLNQLAMLNSTEPARFKRYADRVKDFFARQESKASAENNTAQK